MTKTNVKINIPLEEYNELIELKRTAEKLTAYVNNLGVGVSTMEKVKEFIDGDRVKIVGETWNGGFAYIGRVGVIGDEADDDGDYTVEEIGSNGRYGQYPPSSLELIEE